MNALTAERLRDLLCYEPDTGLFTRKGSARESTVNVIPSGSGYIRFSVGGRPEYGHRLAVLWMTGSLPPKGTEVDHINGCKSDNRWSNLRVVSVQENQQNRRKPTARNQLGILGVTPDGKKFRASITMDGRVRNIGSFATAELAQKAYLAEKRKLHAGFVL